MSEAECSSGRRMAGRLMEVFPSWLVLRGAYTRQFWAFPCFAAPPGTIVHAGDANELAAMIRQVQRAVAQDHR